MSLMPEESSETLSQKQNKNSYASAKKKKKRLQ
jgi:hypothetical protein